MREGVREGRERKREIEREREREIQIISVMYIHAFIDA